MNLPEAFLARMKKQLGAEYDAFVASYDADTSYGLRLNLLKGTVDEIIPVLPFALTNVPWIPEGFHVSSAERPGKHILHEAGAYYIQDPSAMSVITLLDPMPGERILDLCAAPGGKSTGIAARMQGQGLLVSNEIIPGRAKILSQNVERMGITNALVCNESPERIASHFPLFFDRIVVDAPCSGEGMFRKDASAISEWSPENVTLCKERQEMILAYADAMLKPGGVLVYSTCTFAPQEDEEQVSDFLDKHDEYFIEPWEDFLPTDCGIKDGTIAGAMRLYPHLISGEGHFAVRLRKGQGDPHTALDTSDPIDTRQKRAKKNSKKASKSTFDLSYFTDFAKQVFTNEPLDIAMDSLTVFGDELYALPAETPSLKGLKVIRPGLHLGTLKKNRFEPSYALAKALCSDSMLSYETTEEEAARYLHGETLMTSTSLQGWMLVCYQGFPLGFAKATKGTLKNHYPKGLRTQY